jgi:diguanylate cyclase (GGDEF)-like protein
MAASTDSMHPELSEHTSPQQRRGDAASVPHDEEQEPLTPPIAAEISALIEQTLSAGFGLLRFPTRLESQYNRDTAAARFKVLLTAGTIVAFVINLFLVTDYAMVNDMFERGVVLRTWLYTPFMLVGMWVMNRVPSVLGRELMATMAGLLATVIQIYMCTASHSPHALAYLTGLSMFIIYVNVFTRTQFWVAVPYALIILAGYLLALAIMPAVNWLLAAPIFLVLSSTTVFSLYHLYTLEHEERHNYLMSKRQRMLSFELEQANERLELVSRSDALTQVANRRHFDEFLKQLWDRARIDNTEVSLLMLDVDHFKMFNDHYGHPAGDACLVRVARALRECLRRPGDLVARYGGEEFIAVLSKTAADQAGVAGERVRQAVEALGMLHEGSPIYGKVTVSVGVATLRPQDVGASPDKLIALADQALYQAKNRGRNRVWPVPDGRFSMQMTGAIA